jgi:glycosyltransferase involved in cell wall biosynthesis
LTVIGKGANRETFKFLIDDVHVDFIGEVESLTDYYNASAVSVVPLHHGSGTRLKILESMSFGVPVVSTSIGAEGINCDKEVHLLIADSPEDFADKIISLFENEKLFENLRYKANQLVKYSYDWSKIGEALRYNIDYLLKNNK